MEGPIGHWTTSIIYCFELSEEIFMYYIFLETLDKIQLQSGDHDHDQEYWYEDQDDHECHTSTWMFFMALI